MIRIVRGRGGWMGKITTLVSVGSILEPGREVRCEALVDTGAYCLTLPVAWKDQLGVLPVSRRIELATADGRIVAGEVSGPLRIRIDGFEEIAGEVLFIDMPADEEGRYTPLIGYVTLEQACVAVDMVAHRLRHIPRVDLRRALRAA